MSTTIPCEDVQCIATEHDPSGDLHRAVTVVGAFYTFDVTRYVDADESDEKFAVYMEFQQPDGPLDAEQVDSLIADLAVAGAKCREANGDRAEPSAPRRPLRRDAAVDEALRESDN
ncbi:hypothetical protein [Microbacterium sp. NPDC087589]|uniref:hypothetical protein n=1 Tax=Microbacterium sp. NPDC087589 TaxID=3364191 RepID=UPI003828AC72